MSDGKGIEWLLMVMEADANDAHEYRRHIDADRGWGASEESVKARKAVADLAEALAEALQWANEWLGDGPKWMEKARAALARAGSE